MPARRHRHRWFGLRPWQRHSLVNAVAGAVYMFVGVAYIGTPLTEQRGSSLQLALHFAPIQAWGCVWVLVGLLSLVSTRWPPASKTWGYSALSALSAWWGFSYAFGVAFLGAPESSITGALVWFLVAFLWWAIAGLTNPDDVRPVEPSDRTRA